MLELHQGRFHLIEFDTGPEEVLTVAHIADLGQGRVRGEEGVGNDLDGQVAAPHLPEQSHPRLAGYEVGGDHEQLAPGFFQDSLELLGHSHCLTGVIGIDAF